MKRLILVVTVVFLFIGVVPMVFTTAQNDITIIYNGTEIQFDEPPVIQNDRVLVPLNTFLNTLHVHFYWEEGEQSIIFRSVKSGRNYYLKIDRPYAYLEDEGFERNSIDVPPTIVNEKVFIPVRYFAEKLGFDVDWDENTRIVVITKLTHEEGVTAVITYVNREGEGQAPPPKVFLLGQPVRVAILDHPRDVCKRDCTFDGWLDPVTGILYYQGETANFDSDVTLYAAFTNVRYNSGIEGLIW